MTRLGHPISWLTVAWCLHDLEYSLPANVKAIEGRQELIEAFRNAGRTWRPRGQPQRVFTHDFPHLGAGKAIPYGTYDIAQDRAVVNIGITHDTAAFAVESSGGA